MGQKQHLKRYWQIFLQNRLRTLMHGIKKVYKPQVG